MPDWIFSAAVDFRQNDRETRAFTLCGFDADGSSMVPDYEVRQGKA